MLPHWCWLWERYISNWRSQITIWHRKRMTEHYSCAKAFCCDVFLLDCFRCIHSIIMLSFLTTITIFVSEPNDDKIIGQIFSATVFWAADFLYGDLLHLGLTLERRFLSKNIWEGIGATHVRCGGIFNNHFTTNLLVSLVVKEFCNSFKIHEFHLFLRQ